MGCFSFFLYCCNYWHLPAGKISANFRAKPRPTTAAAALVVVATNISSPIERAETQDAVAVALLLSAVSTVKQFVSSSVFSHSLASNHSRSKICLDFARGGALGLGTRKEPLKDMGGQTEIAERNIFEGLANGFSSAFCCNYFYRKDLSFFPVFSCGLFTPGKCWLMFLSLRVNWNGSDSCDPIELFTFRQGISSKLGS